MNEGLMTGMIWGGVLLSSFPIALGIGIGIYAFRRWRAERGASDGSGAAGPAARRT